MSTRENAIGALHAALQAVLAGLSPAPVLLRGETIPQRVPPGGLVVLRDGDTVEETAILSPLAWATSAFGTEAPGPVAKAWWATLSAHPRRRAP
jgi:hypothetical protein